MKSPTQRSLERLRGEGYLAAVVEKWNRYAEVRQDLFGVVDILAIRKGETLAVQATSASNVSARIHKIEDHENTPIIREAGWSFHIHGWKKVKDKWEVRIVDVS